MSARTGFRLLIVIGLLLAACALSLDHFRTQRCDERGGEQKTVNGTITCVYPK